MRTPDGYKQIATATVNGKEFELFQYLYQHKGVSSINYVVKTNHKSGNESSYRLQFDNPDRAVREFSDRVVFELKK